MKPYFRIFLKDGMEYKVFIGFHLKITPGIN